MINMSDSSGNMLEDAFVRFRSELTIVKILSFTLGSSVDNPTKEYVEHFDKPFPDEDINGERLLAIKGGPSTHSGESTLMVLRKRDLDMLRSNSGSVEGQTNALIYRDIYRLLESYLLDLYVLVARQQPKILRSGSTLEYKDIVDAGTYENILEIMASKKKKKLSDGGYEAIVKAFKDIGLDVIPVFENPKHFNELIGPTVIKLTATRNIIEHNRAIVDSTYLNTVKDKERYALGDKLVITLSDLAEAAWATDIVGTLLTSGIARKFPSFNADADSFLEWLCPVLRP